MFISRHNTLSIDTDNTYHLKKMMIQTNIKLYTLLSAVVPRTFFMFICSLHIYMPMTVSFIHTEFKQHLFELNSETA